MPFFPRPRWAVQPDGSRIATLTTDISGPEGGTFRVTVYDARGAEIFSRAYPFEGVPIPGDVVDSAIAAKVARATLPEMRRAIETDAKSRIPPIYPPVEGIVLGGDGRVWIGLRATAEGNPWMILSPEGKPMGRVVLPRNVSLHVADATHVWALERDEVDVQSVLRYRVREPR